MCWNRLSFLIGKQTEVLEVGSPSLRLSRLPKQTAIFHPWSQTSRMSCCVVETAGTVLTQAGWVSEPPQNTSRLPAIPQPLWLWSPHIWILPSAVREQTGCILRYAADCSKTDHNKPYPDRFGGGAVAQPILSGLPAGPPGGGRREDYDFSPSRGSTRTYLDSHIWDMTGRNLSHRVPFLPITALQSDSTIRKPFL